MISVFLPCGYVTHTLDAHLDGCKECLKFFEEAQEELNENAGKVV